MFEGFKKYLVARQERRRLRLLAELEENNGFIKRKREYLRVLALRIDSRIRPYHEWQDDCDDAAAQEMILRDLERRSEWLGEKLGFTPDQALAYAMPA